MSTFALYLKGLYAKFLDNVWVTQALFRGNFLLDDDYLPRKDGSSIRFPMIKTTGRRMVLLLQSMGFALPNPEQIEMLVDRHADTSDVRGQRVIYLCFSGFWHVSYRPTFNEGAFGPQRSPIFVAQYGENPFGGPIEPPVKDKDVSCPKAPIPDFMRRREMATLSRPQRKSSASAHR